MRSMPKMVFVAFAAVLAISAVAASSAFASPEWYAKKAGVFAKITTAVKVGFESKLELVDRSEFGFSCEGAPATGEIKAGGAGVISTFEVKSGGGACKGIKTTGKACELESFSAVNLPWTTSLYAEGTEIRQRYVGVGGTEAGITFKCGGETDTCVFAGSTHMVNNVLGALVEAQFDAKTGLSQCSYSNGKHGEWKGVMKIKPTSTEKSKGVEAIKVE
jgi:hypothetical protein